MAEGTKNKSAVKGCKLSFGNMCGTQVSSYEIGCLQSFVINLDIYI